MLAATINESLQRHVWEVAEVIAWDKANHCIGYFLLTTWFTGVARRNRYLVVGVLLIGVDAGAFWSQMQGGVDVWRDVGNGVVKSVVFGFAVTFIALFQGYEARPTPEGVSRATTKTVVYASLAVLGLDFLLTALMFS